MVQELAEGSVVYREQSAVRLTEGLTTLRWVGSSVTNSFINFDLQ